CFAYHIHDLLSLFQRYTASARREYQAKCIRAEMSSAEPLQMCELLGQCEATNLDEGSTCGMEKHVNGSAARCMCQLTCGCLGARGTHQGFADKDGLGSPGARLSSAKAIGDAALGDKDTILRGNRAQVADDAGIQGKGAQISTVDTDDRSSNLHCATRLSSGMVLNQCLHAKQACEG